MTRRFISLLFLGLSIACVLVQPISTAMAAPLSAAEQKAVNEYANWVANACADTASAPASTPAGTGPTSSSGTMYDSLAPDKIPSDAKVVASYVGGSNTYQQAKRLFPDAAVISINETIGNNDPADIWGIETRSGRTAQSTANAIANGTVHGAYGTQSDLNKVKSILDAKSVPRSSYVLWLWAAGTEGDSSIPAGDDAHQYQIEPGGKAYDVSSISSTFVSTIQGASTTAPITSGSGTDASGACCDTAPTVPVTGGQPTSLIGNNNVQKSFNYFIQAGFTPQQSAGIVGNLMQESGGGTDVNPGSSNGIAGFLDSPVSMSDMQNWVTNNDSGEDPSSLKGQLDFLLWYITKSDPSIGNTIKADKTVEQATIDFQNNFEHCGSPADTQCAQDKRLQYANDVYNGKYGASSVTPGSGSSVDISSIVSKYNLQSVMILNAGNGNNVVASYNPNTPPTTPASTMKLIIADTAIQSGLNLDKTVTVTPDVYYDGKNDLNSSRLTLRDAMQQMLNMSRNVGANVLMKAMGGVDAFTNKAHSYGYTNTDVKGYYDTSNDGINSSTIGDEAAAMNHIFSRNGTDYQTAQDALKQAASSDNTFGLNDIANKWAGTSQVAGNVGLFNINGNQYIIGSYYNGNYTSAEAKNAITNGTQDLVNAISSGAGTSTGSSGTCCPPSTGSDPSTLSGSDNEQKLYNFFTGTMNYTPQQAAGAVGSMMFESHLDPTITNPGSTQAYGIAQWVGSRFTDLQTFAGSNYDTFEGQVSFLKAELTGTTGDPLDDHSSQNADMKKTTSYQDAQKTWTIEFEGISAMYSDQWHFAERNANALGVLNKYGGGAVGSPTGGGPTGASCSGGATGTSADMITKAVLAAQQLSSYNVPYKWGGMHHAGALDLTDPAKINIEGADCSGAVSWVLHQAGMFDPSSADDSDAFMTWAQAGKGSEITVWTKPGVSTGHTFLEFNVPGVGHYQLNTVSPSGNATWEPWSYSNSDAGQAAVDSGAFTPRHFEGT